jgi:hypothetical protein
MRYSEWLTQRRREKRAMEELNDPKLRKRRAAARRKYQARKQRLAAADRPWAERQA